MFHLKWLLAVLVSATLCGGCGGDGDGDAGADADTDTDSDTDTDTDSDTGTDTGLDADCAAAIASLAFDFDSVGSCTAWTAGALGGTGCTGASSFECGTLSGWASPPPSGSGCLGTNLDGSYNNDECSYYDSPAMDLSACVGSTIYLAYGVAVSNESDSGDCRDGLVVELGDGGGTYNPVTPTPGYDGQLLSPKNLSSGQRVYCGLEHDWTDAYVAIGDAYKTASFQVRFYFESDDGYPWDDTYIDDVRVTGTHP